ncbi:hypothetical protein JCM11251_004671 [Rhodosporidiobolus azoricus]
MREAAPPSTDLRSSAAEAGESARPPGSPRDQQLRPASPRTDSFAESSSDPTGSKEDGGGNETDVEDAAVEAMMTPAEVSSEERITVEGGGRAMYPFPPPSSAGEDERWRMARRGSSAMAEPSYATDSSADDDDERMGSADGGAGSVKSGRRKRRRTRTGSASLPFEPSHPPHPAVPHVRRIGALGISVHSDSDDQEDPAVSGLDSEDLRKTKGEGGESSDTRATDLGISTSQLRSSTEDLTGRRKKKRRRVGDSTFRGVVDDLVLQNRELKGRLKRYEARGIPDELKRDRLFEIRFGEALPLDKRLELESYLTRYVQDLAQHPEKDVTLPPPSLPTAHAVPTIPDRARQPPSPRPRPNPFYLNEKQLAGPSNSGVEPVSMTGTGSGMVVPPAPAPRVFPLQPGTPPTAINSAANEAIGREIVASLELLFYHSLVRSAAARSPPPLPPTNTGIDARTPAPSLTASPSLPSPSNETYFSNLLSHDYLSQGFVYTNLACTMAQIHRFPVTLSFVQQAIRQFSTRLEVSDDGGRIRWIGSRDPLELKKDMRDLDDEQKEQEDRVTPLSTVAEETLSRSSGHSLRSGNLQRLQGAAIAAGTNSSSSSLAAGSQARQPSSGDDTGSSSRDPSSGDGSVPTTTNESRSGGGKSLAAPSTAATSLHPSSGREAGDGKGKGKEVSVEDQDLKPVRPVASVLQPMARLRESSAGSGSSSGEKAKSPNTTMQQQQLDAATSTVPVRKSADALAPPTRSRPPVAHYPVSYRAKNLFDRLQEADEEGKSTSGSPSSRAGRQHSRQGVDAVGLKDVTRSGTVVFYANPHFCSDLSKEEQPPAPPALPTPPDEADGKVLAFGASMIEPVGLRARRQSEDESARMSFEDDSGGDAPSSGVLDVETGGSRSPSSRGGVDGQSGGESGTSSLERLKTSGMTSTKPADLFTLVVRSQYPLTSTVTKRPLDARSSISFGDEEEVVDMDTVPSPTVSPPKKQRRTFARPFHAPRIVSTETVYHSATSKKRDPFELAFLSSSSLVESGSGSGSGKTSDEEMSDEEQRAEQVQHLLTSSNLALLSASQHHPHLFQSSSLPPAPQLVPVPRHILTSATPSPPHDDYLLSLSAPSHSWAPREPGLNSKAGTLALSMRAGSLQLHLGATQPNGSSGKGLQGRGGLLNGASSIDGTTMTSTGDERPISLDEMVGLTRAQVAGMQREREGEGR